MEPRPTKIAILVDGDNAQAKLLQLILEEVSKYGKVTIRRIYGDWTSQAMNSWKDLLNELSFSPIQKFAYTKGKNSTDSSLIIDAMDILHDEVVNGFCIVSSDSDYTGLAKRIREEGVFVMGIGAKNTPTAFVNSCEIFTFTENIVNTDVLAGEPEKPVIQNQHNAQASKKREKKLKGEKKQVTPESTKPNATIIGQEQLQIISKAFDISSNDNEAAHVSAIGNSLRKLDPAFDPRAFGFKNLVTMFKSLKDYELILNQGNHPLVKRRSSLDKQK